MEHSQDSAGAAQQAAAGIFVRTVIDRMHQQDALAEIDWPDGHGAFPDASLLPWVFPVVVDANALHDEILRVGKPRTVLATAANEGVLRMYCAPHVVDEVAEHYVQWSADKGVPANAVWDLWQSTYLPLLRCVNTPAGLTEGDQHDRLTRLAMSPDRFGDPDDLPTAALAVLLSAPLLSRDEAPLRAVYGDGFDHVSHGQWLSKLRAGGDLGPIGAYLNVAAAVAVGAVHGSYRGVMSLVARFGWPVVIAAGLTAAASYSLLVPTKTKSTVGSAFDVVLAAMAEAFIGIGGTYHAARAQFDSLSPKEPDWLQLERTLGGEAVLSRACMLTLARSPRSALSVVEISNQLRRRLTTTPCGPDRIRAALQNTSVFAQPTRGRFQLGIALARRESASVINGGR